MIEIGRWNAKFNHRKNAVNTPPMNILSIKSKKKKTKLSKSKEEKRRSGLYYTKQRTPLLRIEPRTPNRATIPAEMNPMLMTPNLFVSEKRKEEKKKVSGRMG
jgi:hypothetical protein